MHMYISLKQYIHTYMYTHRVLSNKLSFCRERQTDGDRDRVREFVVEAIVPSLEANVDI